MPPLTARPAGPKLIIPRVRRDRKADIMRLARTLCITIACAAAAVAALPAPSARAICMGDGDYELAVAEVYLRDAAQLKAAKARARGQTLMPATRPTQTRVVTWSDFSEKPAAEVAHWTTSAAKPH
jgi:hypothetical protein